MKISLFITLLWAGLVALPLSAAPLTEQERIFADADILDEAEDEEEEDDDFIPPTEKDKEQQEQVPEWLAQLSNLPRDRRDEYIAHFAQAKAALAAGNWVDCDAELTSCEFIFNKNPNVHNLRVVCYIEQKRLDAATEELEKARALLPDDATTLVNAASLHMAKKAYRTCIREMTDVLETPSYNISQEVRDILTFRVFLCHLMLGEVSQAEEWVSELSPISDTPLFYYSRAAVCLYLRDAHGAQRDLQSAANIFSEGGLLVPYQRALLSCDLTEAKH